MTTVSLNDLGSDMISLIYDELRCENKDYITKFITFLSKQLKTCKCSKKGSDVLHTDVCHDKVVDIVFGYVKNLTDEEINQIIINTGIGEAIEIFYLYNITHGEKNAYEIGKRIRGNLKWRGISWDIEKEMVFLILMRQVYIRYNYE